MCPTKYPLFNLLFEYIFVKYKQIGGYAVAVEANSIPRVMFFAEDDDYVDAKLSYDLAKLMGINTESTHRFTGQLDRSERSVL